MVTIITKLLKITQTIFKTKQYFTLKLLNVSTIKRRGNVYSHKVPNHIGKQKHFYTFELNTHLKQFYFKYI